MKKRRRTEGFPKEVSRVQRLVSQWRATRKKRGRMPEELWREAVGAARQHGIYRTAKASGLCYESLKQRVAQDRDGSVGLREAVSNSFVEVDPDVLLGCSHETVATVEMHRPDGVRVVIRVPPGTQLDVAALCAAACGGPQ